ncbi:hypothetical protein ACRRTK_013887 [Alexandromys fortis]
MSEQKCGFTLKNIVCGEMLAFHEVSRNNCLCSFSVLKAWPHPMIVLLSQFEASLFLYYCIVCLGFIFPILCPENYFLLRMSKMLC